MWGSVHRGNRSNPPNKDKWAVCNCDTENGIATHIMKTNHKILREKANVIEMETWWTRRKVKESFIIRRTPNDLNLDNGLHATR